MNAIALPTYTQDDLDADIDGIDADFEDVGLRVKRIKDNWADVAHLHPNTDAVDYIRAHVPFLIKNTAAAVAMIEAGVTTADAGRLTGRTQQAVSKAASKARSTTSVVDKPRPTTLKGKTAPGPAVGTPKPVTKPKKKEATKKPIVSRPIPPLINVDQWDKVLSSMSVILAADADHVIAALNQKDAVKRKAGANLMRSTAIRLNQLRKEIKP